MIVCVCNNVSDADIRRQAASGVADFATLQDVTGCSTCCGCCEDMARRLFAEARATTSTARLPLALPVAVAA